MHTIDTPTHPAVEATTEAEMTLMAHLATKLERRGTRPFRGPIRHRLEGAGFPPSAMLRNWRYLAARWLRRHLGGEWHIGGRHVGRPHFRGHAVGERQVPRGNREIVLRVGGVRTGLEVVR